jgi:signal recognition particle receptor subunit beta
VAHIDLDTGDIVVRLAYDGASSAGKTTNVQRLHAQVLSARPGDIVSPATTGRETVFFDWREFDGGYLQNRRIRVQLLSLPGQPSRAHRRRHLLSIADAVVFVVDAEAARHDVNIAMAALLAQARAHRPFPVVVQRNKIDLAPPSLQHDDLLASLQLPADTPVVDANAIADVGVTETFLLACRLMTAAIRDRVSTLPVVDARVTAETLHAELVELDAAVRPPLPSPTQHLRCWPPSAAVDVMAAFAAALPSARLRWASSAARGWSGNQHIIETLPAWAWETRSDADEAFDEVVAQQERWQLEDSRRVVLCREGGFYRLWLLTRDLPTWPPSPFPDAPAS